jgi:chromosome segregation ATPase
MKTTTLLSVLAGCALAATALSAGAQGQPAPRKVDRAELRYCLDTADTIKARNETLKERAAKVRAQQEELKVEGEAIQKEVERQESGTGGSIGIATNSRDRLERRKGAYGRKIEEGKAEALALQPEADKLNADLATYNQRCSGISFDREDREAVDKERAAAGKK